MFNIPEEKKAAVRQAVTLIAEDLTELVKGIESDKCPITQYNYGQYLEFLTQIRNDKGENIMLFFCVAMVHVGGSRDGIYHALKILMPGITREGFDSGMNTVIEGL